MADTGLTGDEAPKTDAQSPFIFANISRGDPVAPLARRCPMLQREIDPAAGRYAVLCFFLTEDSAGAAALKNLAKLCAVFSKDHVAFIAIGTDARHHGAQQERDDLKDVAFVLDANRAIARTFGTLPLKDTSGRPSPARRCWIILDPTQHVLAVIPFSPETDQFAAVEQILKNVPPPKRYSPVEIPPPVLLLPNVFDDRLRQRLIAAYDRHGGAETGVVIGSPRGNELVIDNTIKRRRDYKIQEKDLIEAAHACLRKRVVPEIERLFYMRITRVDRNIVACYAAEDGAHFISPHRDNNTDATAYRRFAISVNLNDDFEGGAVRFPEYNDRAYKAPAGWALVFPCAVLHQVTHVTQGRRYVFLPFVFEEPRPQG